MGRRRRACSTPAPAAAAATDAPATAVPIAAALPLPPLPLLLLPLLSLLPLLLSPPLLFLLLLPPPLHFPLFVCPRARLCSSRSFPCLCPLGVCSFALPGCTCLAFTRALLHACLLSFVLVRGRLCSFSFRSCSLALVQPFVCVCIKYMVSINMMNRLTFISWIINLYKNYY